MCVHIIELKMNVKKMYFRIFETVWCAFGTSSSNKVEDAFSNHSAVLSAFSFLDPSHLPEEAKDVHDYGKVNHFLKFIFVYFFSKNAFKMPKGKHQQIF